MGHESLKNKMGCICKLSAILFICGLAVFGCAAGIASMNQMAGGDASSVDPMAMMQQMGTGVLIVLGIAIIGLGIQGMILSRCKAKWCIMLFGCGLGFVALILFIFGCIFASSNGIVSGGLDAMCKNKVPAQNPRYLSSSSADTGMLKLLNTNMCTSSCPCDAATYQQGYSSVSTANYTFNGRTKQAGTGKDANGRIQMNTVPNGGFKTFKDCWDGALAVKQTDKQTQAATNGYLKTMQALENKFQCSGVCVPGLFYFTQPMTSQPKKGCQEGIITMMGSGYTIPGYILIISSFLVLLIFAYQYCVWCDKPEDEWKN